MDTETMDIGLPAGIEVNNTSMGLEIIRRWFSFKFIPLTIFAVIWDGFLIVFYSRVLQINDTMPLFFSIAHFAVGIGLTYYVIAGYLNKTYIQVNNSNLIIYHSPIPFIGHRDIRSDKIVQLYSKEHISRGRNSQRISYAVHVILKNRKNTFSLKKRKGSFLKYMEIWLL